MEHTVLALSETVFVLITWLFTDKSQGYISSTDMRGHFLHDVIARHSLDMIKKTPCDWELQPVC